MRRAADKLISFYRKDNGYTLVEMAIILIVVGMFIAVGYPLYDHYLNKTKYDQTLITQVKIDKALESFKEIRGRYPCPAPLSAAPGNVNYGRETCGNSTLAAGTCADGLCYEQSPRTINVTTTEDDGTETTQNIRPRVIRGAIPFRTLGIMEEDSYDAYSGRFGYAVTELLTNQDTFRVERGGIEVIDGNEPNPNSLVDPPASALYYVFSAGPDNVGAYSRDGYLLAECDGPMHDNQNCNTDATHSEAVYRHTLRSTVPIEHYNASKGLPGGGGIGATNNTHFDDSAAYVGIGKPPIWEKGENIDLTSTDSINLTDSVRPKVVIGEDMELDDQDTSLKLNVRGGVLLSPTGANPGHARINQICDENTANCMVPQLLAGPLGGPDHLKCAEGSSGPAPIGVDSRVIRCVPPIVSCPEGQLLRGFDAERMPVCGEHSTVRCGAEAHSLCNTVLYLPNNTSVGTTHVLTAGASRRQSFTCTRGPDDQNEGIWTAGAITGVCSCTPGVTRVTTPCAANMQGEIVEDVTTTCPDGRTTRRQVSNSCTCVPSTRTNTQNCPANFNGTRTTTTTVTCNGNRPVVNVRETANTCTCNPRAQNRTQACPAGFTGRINQSRTVQCPAGTWGPWANVSNSCRCRSSYTQQVACPAGMNIGSITETCSYSCNAANLTATGPTCRETSNTCSCRNNTAVTQERCGDGYTGQVRVTTTTVCPGGAQTVTRDRSNCVPETNTCTMTVIDNNTIGTSRTPWREGQSCTSSGNDTTCSRVQFCYRTLGAGVYTTHRCSCQ